MDSIFKFLPWDASLTINTLDLMNAIKFSNGFNIGIITFFTFLLSFIVINSVSVTPTSKKDVKKQRLYWWIFLIILAALVILWNYWVYISFFEDATFASMFISHIWLSTFLALVSFVLLSLLLKYLLPYWRYGELKFI